ncbi:hypothetical protein [Actinacidiphila glaucinigra]|uniref:hypothetical protein n=1 Tax=Actinacidiphila glaucinigra TaxID=235986 RepID=UPI002E2FCC30|nr:hypothetical protein [Actinacidiphila glaucinigra]
MPKTRLKCRNASSAAAVVAAGTEPGDRQHTVRQDGRHVVIAYADTRWPFDVAEWAALEGHASDKAAARVMAGL